jgi:hypothetical protein
MSGSAAPAPKEERKPIVCRIRSAGSAYVQIFYLLLRRRTAPLGTHANQIVAEPGIILLLLLFADIDSSILFQVSFAGVT